MATVSYQWSGPDTGGLTDPANWTPTGIPGSGDIADFGQAGSSADIAVTGSDTVGELDVHGDAVTLGSGAVTANGLADASYNQTVGTAIDAGGSLALGTATTTAALKTDTLYVGALSQGSLTVNAGSTLIDTNGYVGYIPPTNISGYSPDGHVTVTGTGAVWANQSLIIGGGGLTVAAGGTVSVAGTLDDIDGAVTLDRGTLHTGGMRIGVGGALDLNASSTVTGTVELDGGAIDATGSGAFTLSDPIALDATNPAGIDTIDAGNTQLTLTGAISDHGGPGALGIKGFVRLAHAENGYSGGTFLDSGANLRIAADGAAGIGPIVMDAPDVTLAVAPHVLLTNGIEGFQQGDQIVLAGVTATSASWSNGSLDVFDSRGDAVASLNLAGNYAGATFSVKGNGDGDSIVTVNGYQRTLVWNGTGAGFESATGWTPAGIPTANDVTKFIGPGGTVAGPGTAGEIVVDAPMIFAPPGAGPVTFTAAGLYDPTLGTVAGLSIDHGGSLLVPWDVTLDANAAYVGLFGGGGSITLQGGTIHDTTANLGYDPVYNQYTPSAAATLDWGTWTVDQSLHALKSKFVFVAATLSVGTTATLDDSTVLMDGGHFHAQQITLEGGSTLNDESGDISGAIDLANGTITGIIGQSDTVGLYNDITLSEDAVAAGLDTLSGNGVTLSVAGAITDDAGGSPGLTVNGAVALVHTGNSYASGTTLSGSGTNLTVDAQGAAGSGDIAFTAGDQTLTVAAGVTLANTIKGFRSTDTIDLEGVQATSAAWQNGTLTLGNGATGVATLAMADNAGLLGTDYPVLQFTASSDGYGGTDIAVGQPAYASTDTLTTGTDTITGTAGNDLIIAPPGTLNAGDTIDGGGGFNALELQGGGIFHVNAPTTLQNVQALYASEGGTSSDQQNVFLRDGTDMTVEVQGSSDNPKTPWLNSITLHGANNSDTIYCGPGYDTVVLGSANETVVGGSGTVGIVADIGMLGSATLSGGSGGGTLLVTGGGSGGMSANITRIQTVVLSDAHAPDYRAATFDFTANSEAGLTIIGNTGGDTIQAGGANQTIIGATTYNSNLPHLIGGFDTMIGSTQGYDTFKDPLVDFGFSTIENFSAPGDVIDVTDVSPDGLSVGYGEGIPETNAQLVIDGVGITLIGTFTSSGFHTASDGHGGTDITYTAPTTTATATASKLSSAMASFSAPGGGALDASNSSSLDQHTPLLAASSGHT